MKHDEADVSAADSFAAQYPDGGMAILARESFLRGVAYARAIDTTDADKEPLHCMLKRMAEELYKDNGVLLKSCDFSWSYPPRLCEHKVTVSYRVDYV